VTSGGKTAIDFAEGLESIDYLKSKGAKSVNTSQDYDLARIHIEQREESVLPIIKEANIGAGAFGQVYKVSLEGKKTTFYAMKEIAITVDDPEEKIIRELTIHSCLNHPHIIKPLGIRRDTANVIGLVMIYAELGTLHQYIRTQDLFEWIRLVIANDIVEAMIYLYSRPDPIFHRDLKTKNILIGWISDSTNDTNNSHHFRVGALVSDFGLSDLRSVQNEKMYETIGYQWILSPERFCYDSKGEPQPFTEKADVYSFGLVLWEMLTRRDLVVEDFEPPHQLASAKIIPEILELVQAHPNNAKLLSMVARGYRPRIPDDCPVECYPYIELMKRCWHQSFEERPTFREIKEILGTLKRFNYEPKAAPVKPEEPARAYYIV